MFESRRLIHCQQREASLIQQSTLRRRALRTEAQNLHPVAGWVDLGIDIARKARTAWSFLAPLFSLRQTRQQESSGFVHKLADAVSIARSVLALWRSWRSQCD